MRVGRDVDDGFEILDDHGDMIGAAYLDQKSGRVDVTLAASYSGLDQLPTMSPQMQEFAEKEFRRRKQNGR